MTARTEHETGTPADRARSSAPQGSRALARSTAAMASGTLVSRVLGLLRNALLVAVVGLATVGGMGGSMADAWSVANKLPNIISMLLAGGVLNAVLVPQVVRALRRPDGGQEHVNRLLTAAIVVLAGITVVLTAAASLLIGLYAHSFPPEWKAVAVALAYWCIPQLFFYGLYTLLGQVLNARSIFGPYMWAPAVNNVIAIAGLIAFLLMFGGLPDGGLPPSAWTPDKVALLAGTATLGVVAQALVLIVPLYRSGFRFRPVWGFRGHGLGSASTIAVWAFGALAVGQLAYLAVSNVAAAASAAAEQIDEPIAGNFAYDNAFLIFMLPQSLVTVSLVTALFTRVSHNAAARDGAKVRDDLSFGLRTLGVFTVFAATAFAVLAIPLVQVVLLDRADFGSYRAVAAVLVAMAFGLSSMAVWTMVQRVFYAYEDTRTLFRIQVPMALILAGGSLLAWWLLEPQWWVVGTGAATTLSNTVGALVGYLAARKYLPSLDGARVLRTYLRVLMAAVPVGLLGWGALHLWGVQTGFLGALLRVVVLGAVMLTAYVLLVRALRVTELDALLARLGGPVGRVLAKVRRRGGASAVRTMSARGPEHGGEPEMSVGSSATLASGEILAGRYRLERRLAEPVDGATQWDATDTALDVAVAVLLIEGEPRDDTVDAARRAALIDDPRLPRVLRAGVEGAQGFVVTEAVAGVPLSDLVRTGPLPPSQARALIGEAAVALENARRRGVHHLALGPGALVRTVDGSVRVTGLGTDAALRSIEVHEARAASRRDAIALVQLLYTALTGTWPGSPDLADGVPAALRDGDAIAPAGDVVATIPNDLDTLCAVTMGEHDDGPLTPGELVADLAPWGAIDVRTPLAPLPPALAPGDAIDLPIPVAPLEDDGGPDTAMLDTSGWAPHQLPAVSEPTPFADLVADTGTIPAVGSHPLRHQRTSQTHVSLPRVAAAGAAVAGAGAATPPAAPGTGPAPEEPAAPVAEAPVNDPALVDEAPVEEAAVEEARVEEAAVEEAAVVEPLAEAGGALAEPEAAEALADEAGADDQQAAAEPAPARLSVAGLPVLARAPRGWDHPGGDAPEVLPEPEPEPEPAADVDTEPAAAAVAGMSTGAEHSPLPGPPAPTQGTDEAVQPSTAAPAAAATTGFAPLRGTNRRINSAAGKVSGGAKRVADDVGGRVGAVSSRVGTFVDDVRDEFRPVEPVEGQKGSRFNPAPIALCAMIALVIFGLVMAVLTLKDASSSYVPGPDPGEVPPSATATQAPPTTEPAAEPTPSQEPESEGLPSAGDVGIASAATFDPTVTGGENQDDAYLAYDGNPDTTWNSLRYNSPTYGMKDGLGFTVTLEDTALVSSVTLDVKGEGGRVEIRVGNADSPSSGEVLASGALGGNVTYTFDEPVEADAISLWFPELPVSSSDGRNRIELAEIRLG